MINRMRYFSGMFCFVLLLVLLCAALAGCSETPPSPSQVQHICRLFRQHPTWYWSAKQSAARWGISIPVQMAVLREESHFREDAKPARKKILGLIPWIHKTSASGYTQATDGTWRLYLRDTQQRAASRARFSSAVDFVGWFLHRAQRELRIPKKDAFLLYLAYHEGVNGYRQQRYRRKPDIVRKALKVERDANRYRRQLQRCQPSLPKIAWWYRLFANR